MTANGNLKRQVRARAAKTGESYTSALRHFRPNPTGDVVPQATPFRMAVAQSNVRSDPRSADELRDSGKELRELMRQARESGAKLVHFTEGATCFPNKLVMSVDGPEQVGHSDWTRFQWGVLQQELQQIAALAGHLGLWTVFGSVHQLTPPNRPHNSLYVINDRGRLVTRYDERFLSNTKISFMYAPGTAPVMFEVDGVRFGLALGMEAHFPEVFAEYERLDVDCVLYSTTAGMPSEGPTFATQTQGHAAVNSYWVSFAAPSWFSPVSPSGMIDPNGNWLARCPDDGTPSVVTVDLDASPENVDIAVRLARPWRREARAHLYARHVVEGDSRSSDRSLL